MRTLPLSTAALAVVIVASAAAPASAGWQNGWTNGWSNGWTTGTAINSDGPKVNSRSNGVQSTDAVPGETNYHAARVIGIEVPDED